MIPYQILANVAYWNTSERDRKRYQNIHMAAIPGSKGYMPNSSALRKMLFQIAAVNVILQSVCFFSES